MNYFDHDTDARNDSRIVALRFRKGGAAVDAYWAVIETMCQEQRPLPADCEEYQYQVLSCQLLTSQETLCEWMEEMTKLGLLVNDGDFIYSPRARDNWEAYQEKVEANRKKAKKRWNKDGNAEAMPQHSNSIGSAIQKEKEKEKEGTPIKGCTPPGADNGAVAVKTAPVCPKCGGEMVVEVATKKATRYWCRSCQEATEVRNVRA